MRDIDKRTNGWKQRKEALSKKTDVLVQMIDNAWKSGIDASFVLFDSWFSHDDIIRRIVNIGYGVICRLKRGRVKYGYQGKEYTLKQLWRQFAKKNTAWIKDRTIKGVSLDVTLKKTGQIRVLFVSDGRKQWQALLCTDTELESSRILEYYARRWSIETGNESKTIHNLWVRGGFPESYLAADDAMAMDWLEDLIRTYLERDLPQLGFRVPAIRMRRLLTMLAHLQGEPVNYSKLGANLEIDGKTVSRYIDILSDLLLVRRLEPWHANVKKRLIKAPRYYIRDSGILHRLLGIDHYDALLSNPVLGKSWEGFVVENIHSVLPRRAETYFTAPLQERRLTWSSRCRHRRSGLWKSNMVQLQNWVGITTQSAMMPALPANTLFTAVTTNFQSKAM